MKTDRIIIAGTIRGGQTPARPNCFPGGNMQMLYGRFAPQCSMDDLNYGDYL